jgi:hypothetical protein
MAEESIQKKIWDTLGCEQCRIRINDASTCFGPPSGQAFYCNSETWRCPRDGYYNLKDFEDKQGATETEAPEAALGTTAIKKIVSIDRL